MNENHFVVIGAFCNCAKYVKQFLISIAGQFNHKNWQIILVDDLSTDNSNEIIEQYSKQLEIQDKITIIKNTEKKYEVANILQALKLCNDDDFVLRIDPDDFLENLNCFWILNEIINQQNCDALYTEHRWFDDKTITNTNISRPMPKGWDAYQGEWLCSHLKGFRKKLLNNVKDENYRNQDGEYAKRAGDQYIFRPALYNAKKITFVPIRMYAYRCDMSPQTFQSDDARYQKLEADFLMRRGYVR